MEKKLVLPGDFLVYEEEFESGKNTFEEDGKIYAAACGMPEYNNKNRTVAVEKHRKFQPITRDTIIVGRVVQIKAAMVGLEVLSAERDGIKQILRDNFVMLPVRNMAREYVENAHSLYHKGDIVRARVCKVTPYGVDVRTDEPDLGVIIAYSVETRTPLRLFGNSLKCEVSGKTEQRKVSSEYIIR